MAGPVMTVPREMVSFESIGEAASAMLSRTREIMVTEMLKTKLSCQTLQRQCVNSYQVVKVAITPLRNDCSMIQLDFRYDIGLCVQKRSMRYDQLFGRVRKWQLTHVVAENSCEIKQYHNAELDCG